MKKTGKVLSLVLSLALVASSLVATTASAAAASETATTTLTNDTLYLANGGSGNTLKFELVDTNATLGDGTNYFATSGSTLYDHQPAGTPVLKDVAVTSGSGIATVKVTKDTSGTVTGALLTLTNASVQGTVTIAGRYESSIQRGTNTDPSNVYSQATLTVKVLKNGTTVIGKGVSESNAETAKGKYPDALDTLPKTPDAVVYGKVETVSHADANAEATWKLDTVAASAADGSYLIATSGVAATLNATVDSGKAFSLTSKAAANTSKPTEFSSTGAISIAAQKYTGSTPVASTDPLEKATATTSVTNTVKAVSADTTISVYQGVTYLAAGVVDGTTVKTTDAVNVTGADVDLTDATGAVTMEDGSVGKVTTNGDYTFTVANGTVSGGIVANGNVTVTKGSVNNIVIPTAVSEKTVTINGGTVGNVTDTDGANTVTIQSTDDTLPVTVGNVTACAVTVDSNNNAAVKVGNIKINGSASPALTLCGDKVTVGQIDCDYRAVTLSLNGFKGSVAAPSNTYTPGLSSVPVYTTLSVANGTINTDAIVTGSAFFNTITLTSGMLTFDGTVKIGANGVSGAGTMKVAPNALYAQGPVSGIYLKLTKDFKAGDTVFTADTGKVYVGSFNPVGFTVKKTTPSTTVDAFVVDTVVFAGVQITGSPVIELNTTENYVASPYPNGTSLPTGEKISWSFSGNSNYLVATADATDSTKISVKAIKQDTTFASLNQGTLTATVVDAYGFRDYSYDPVTFDVAIGTKAASFKIDSVPKTMKIGQQYTVKITGTDATAPQVAFAGDFAIINSKTVSGYDTFVKFTAAKSGEHGVYVSGTKVAVIKVDTASICDTKTVTKKAGQSYTFKVTSSAVSFVPQFGVASISGNIKPTKQVGKDFYYTVKATSAKGAHGVYINGVKVATYTFA